MTLEKILKELPLLSREDLLCLEERIAALKVLSGDNNIILADVDDFYVVLDSVLQEHGIKCLPWYVFRTSKTYKAYLDNCVVMNEFIDNNFKNISQNDRTKLYLLFLSLVLNNLNEFITTINQTIIINSIKRIPELFNASYPGYIRSGLGKAVLGSL